MPSTNRRYYGRDSPGFKRIRKNLAIAQPPCWLCGQPIDYSLPRGDKNSFTADHILPLETHPELAEDPGNIVAAHWGCNSSKGSGSAPLGLGNRSEDW